MASLDSIKITDPSVIIRAARDREAELVTRRWSWPGPTGKPVYNFRSEGRTVDKGRCLIFHEFLLAQGSRFYPPILPPSGAERYASVGRSISRPTSDRSITFRPSACSVQLRRDARAYRLCIAAAFGMSTLRRGGWGILDQHKAPLLFYR